MLRSSRCPIFFIELSNELPPLSADPFRMVGVVTIDA